MKVGSLFTGYGGLDMAVGGELAWYAEIEKAACQVLATHHPNVPNLGDITTIDWSTVEPVDVLTGGYPCQPFSHAGKRKGKNDERHLWPYVLDAICAIRPRYAILENVSGHLSLGFDSVLTDLAKIGWAAEWGTFRASDIGAPHRRERLFIIAYATRRARGTGTGRGVPEPERSTGFATHVGDIAADTEHDGLNGGTVTRSIGESQDQGRLQQPERRDSDLAADTSGDGHGQQLHAGTMAGVERQATGSAQQWQRSRRESDPRSVDATADTAGSARTGTESSNLGSVTRQATESGERFGDSADTDNRHGQTIGGVSGLRGRHAARGDMPEMSTVDWGKYAPAIRRWESVLDRPAPAPTVERKDKRRLNPQFVEWMMGLPDGWVTGHGLSAAQELKMLGNGVVPQQARAAITQLLERTQQ